jgi:hypothetical protein
VRKLLQSEDYHTEMNAHIFESWVHEKLLPNMPNNGVLVLDRASYHMTLRPESRCASSSSRKIVLVQWLIDHDVKDHAGRLYTEEYLVTLKKMEVYAICQDNKPKKMFALFDWIKDWNESYNTDIQINILPIAHPELNPIEIIWCWLKTWVASNNHQFTMSSIHELVFQKVPWFTAEQWKKATDKSHRYLEGCVIFDDLVGAAMEESDDEDDNSDEEEEEEGSIIDTDESSAESSDEEGTSDDSDESSAESSDEEGTSDDSDEDSDEV